MQHFRYAQEKSRNKLEELKPSHHRALNTSLSGRDARLCIND